MKKFILGIVLCVLIWIAPLAFTLVGIIVWGDSGFYDAKGWFITAFISVLVLLISKEHCYNLLFKGRREKDYDEFGNAKSKHIKNLSKEEQDAIDMQSRLDVERILPTSVAEKIVKKGSTTPEKDLAKLIGMNDVKNKLTELSARMEFEYKYNSGASKKEKKNSMSGRHFCFYGSAGTGKTTVARIITGFLYRYGYIKKNKVVEVDGNFLKSGADTSRKVQLVIQKAYDGVLFIDEAYVLCEGAYGDEAIATLIKEMEDNRDRFICILAGYTKDMNKLLDSNTGFKSRIKEYLNFPDYSIEDMKQIFQVMANEQNFYVDKGAFDNLEIRLEKEKKLKTFGNGRTVRNVLDEAIDKHAVNFIQKKIPAEKKFAICKEDVSTAVKLNGIT